MTKKVIPVKQISQPPIGGYCTVFSLCMVVNFYGIKISPRKLFKYFDKLWNNYQLSECLLVKPKRSNWTIIKFHIIEVEFYKFKKKLLSSFTFLFTCFLFICHFYTPPDFRILNFLTMSSFTTFFVFLWYKIK